ncbi:uncharacterized protein LOC117624122 isoform X1 [Prunus dulcis]|uniref:uncharacterized protein LOC117624122 isoform X1 n=1 Tax=Prunus dulcis TaxID=3755 RepID=UPI001481FB95|nr:uncharacterized protein LOC117624122 isoform X1 [Prunus dulcis]
MASSWEKRIYSEELEFVGRYSLIYYQKKIEGNACALVAIVVDFSICSAADAAYRFFFIGGRNIRHSWIWIHPCLVLVLVLVCVIGFSAIFSIGYSHQSSPGAQALASEQARPPSGSTSLDFLATLLAIWVFRPILFGGELSFLIKFIFSKKLFLQIMTFSKMTRLIFPGRRDTEGLVTIVSKHDSG